MMTFLLWKHWNIGKRPRIWKWYSFTVKVHDPHRHCYLVSDHAGKNLTPYQNFQNWPIPMRKSAAYVWSRYMHLYLKCPDFEKCIANCIVLARIPLYILYIIVYIVCMCTLYIISICYAKKVALIISKSWFETPGENSWSILYIVHIFVFEECWEGEMEQFTLPWEPS